MTNKYTPTLPVIMLIAGLLLSSAPRALARIRLAHQRRRVLHPLQRFPQPSGAVRGERREPTLRELRRE